MAEISGVVNSIIYRNSENGWTVLELCPDDTRQNIVVNCLVKTTLAPSNPATTMLYAVDEHTVVEMVPQIPGQIAVDGSEQEAPARLKLVNFE